MWQPLPLAGAPQAWTLMLTYNFAYSISVSLGHCHVALQAALVDVAAGMSAGVLGRGVCACSSSSIQLQPLMGARQATGTRADVLL